MVFAQDKVGSADLASLPLPYELMKLHGWNYVITAKVFHPYSAPERLVIDSFKLLVLAGHEIFSTSETKMTKGR